MIYWRLAEVMARYRITGVALAKELGVRDETVSKWRSNPTLPYLDGKKAEELIKALSKLADKQIRFKDLVEEEEGIVA
jgi:hypothetical protein